MTLLKVLFYQSWLNFPDFTTAERRVCPAPTFPEFCERVELIPECRRNSDCGKGLSCCNTVCDHPTCVRKQSEL